MGVEIHEAEEWSAVYLDGVLQRVGDSYLADEWVRAHFGVTTVQDDAFMRGQNARSGVAPTLTALAQYRDERDAARAEAERLRAEAARLLAEADGLATK